MNLSYELVLLLILIIYVVCMMVIVWSARRTSCDEEYEDEYEVEDPTREELDALKFLLDIKKGSLQFKSGAVYHVTYDVDVRKHRWKRLGSYEELTSQVLSNG